MNESDAARGSVSIPWFGARKLASALTEELRQTQTERESLRRQLKDLGGLTIIELQTRRQELEAQIETLAATLRTKPDGHAAELASQVSAHASMLPGREETARFELQHLTYREWEA